MWGTSSPLLSLHSALPILLCLSYTLSAATSPVHISLPQPLSQLLCFICQYLYSHYSFFSSFNSCAIQSNLNCCTTITHKHMYKKYVEQGSLMATCTLTVLSWNEIYFMLVLKILKYTVQYVLYGYFIDTVFYLSLSLSVPPPPLRRPPLVLVYWLCPVLQWPADGCQWRPTGLRWHWAQTAPADRTPQGAVIQCGCQAEWACWYDYSKKPKPPSPLACLPASLPACLPACVSDCLPLWPPSCLEKGSIWCC